MSEMDEPLVWESTTPAYIRWITDSRYRKFRPAYQKWYRPICPKCGPNPLSKEDDMTFSEEYPHLSDMLKWIGRCMIGIAASLIAVAIVREMGSGQFAQGWIGCMVFMLVGKP